MKPIRMSSYSPADLCRGRVRRNLIPGQGPGPPPTRSSKTTWSSQTPPAGRTGITAAGLVLGLAAAGLLIALAVPLHERARNAAAFKSTLSDIRLWDDAIKAYIAVQGAAPANPKGPIFFKKPIVDELAPFMGPFRTLDWWGYNYQVWTGPGNREYGVSLTAAEDYLIVSTGKGGVREAWAYDPARPDAGLFAVEAPEDYEKDIVIWNGRLVRGPKGAR